jgi:hypothetical protein
MRNINELEFRLKWPYEHEEVKNNFKKSKKYKVSTVLQFSDSKIDLL